jgi:putative hemolysin
MEASYAIEPSHYPVSPERLPQGSFDDGPYRLRFASDARDLDRVLRLRFGVFNLELAEGLASSFDSGRDEDEFDAVVHHLIVEERSSGDVVGTYRLQTGEMAAAHRGFYSSAEYDLARFPAETLAQSIEIGRACIARPHRNRQVLFHLWKGLAEYLITNRKRFLFGCCSITSQDPAVGMRAARQLRDAGQAHPAIHVGARDEYACTGVEPATSEVEIPILFRTYLRHGAKVISEPALDRRFGTVDFLVLLDVRDMAARSFELYFGERGGLIP